MKYIKKYESFKNNRSETVNEEFLGSLIGGIKNLFKKSQERTNKAKGGKEVETIYQKYLNMITTELAKTAQIDLNVAAASKGDLPAAATATATTNDANAKLAVDTLKKKKAVMDQIVQRLKGTALKEMDAVLTKFGGAAANPQLKIIIDTKKDQFEMDYLNAQIGYLDKAGDKTMLATISKERDALSKSIEADFKDFDTAKPVIYAVGDTVIYKRDAFKDANKEKWNSLTDDDKKKPTEGKIKELETAEAIGIKKISKIEGDKVSFEGVTSFTKTKEEILMKVGTGEKEEGQEDLTKKLSDMKAKNPDDIKVVSKIVDFMNDEKNDAEVEEIGKIINKGQTT
jgi:hypothetical protein